MSLVLPKREETSMGLNVLKMTIHQYRRLYQFTAGYLGLLFLAGLVVESPANSLITGLMTVPFVAVLIQTMVAFINPDADLAAAGSHYPSYLLRLPVKTHVLALWPMLAGSLWAASSWIIFAGFFLHRRGVPMEVVTPCLGLVAVVFSMQALMWTPFRYGGLRLLLMLLIPLTLVVTGIWQAGFGYSALIRSLEYVAVILVSGSLAWRGVVCARTTPLVVGSMRFREQSTKEIVRIRPYRPLKSFDSALKAQVWMEWRLQGRILPIVNAAVLALASVPLLLDGNLLTPLGSQGAIRPWVYSMLGIMPFVPVVLATWVGMGARKPSMRTEDGAYHLFNATRPLHSKDVIKAKMIAFSIGTAISWATTLGVGLLWLLLPAVDADGISTSGLAVMIAGMDSTQWICAGAALVLLIGLTWRNQLVGAFVDYVPKRWMAVGYPLFVAVTGSLIFAAGSEHVFTRSDGSFEPWFVFSLAGYLIVKLGVALQVGTRILLRRPEEIPLVSKVVGLYAGGVVAATALLSWFANLQAAYSSGVSSNAVQVAVLIAAIIVPITRPLLARLALETGRHR